ncbi:alkaline and neutral invertase [Nitrosomonas cryotolerans]|uniref:beta-fructofuranosidase n=1 Tax=Nitrosomonas cryotolerans ATCC 49181 TaxID=1131553 RepID=A0A1N6HH84_9PROT|nr:glycoside hydrolase 100 family protein [Nitrosomonas cryotolerans]SFQ17342.1 alkaline and neutral invertase [Nitrosomonas cryotolerans]SIO19005.1 Alkaline and neutral invertase [Nitrosomonas cryotolerans ATCC 49181]
MIDTKLIDTAWCELYKSVIEYKGQPVGTVAARDPGIDILNYDHCFVRDFAVSALAFLMRGDTEIVRNFLTIMVELQGKVKYMNCFMVGKGLMPASFRVVKTDGIAQLEADFGEKSIARVSPVDSGLWWLIVLRAYVRATGDTTLIKQPEFQQAIKLTLELFLEPHFDMRPTLLVTDGAYMIDRRMGVYGYPFDIQSLLFAALSAARELLIEDGYYYRSITERLTHLSVHLQNYYWLDFDRLNTIYRYNVEGYGSQVINAFNIQPSTIKPALIDWLPAKGGYFAGNVGPGRMDFRYFAQGNLLAIVSSLATQDQSHKIMALIEQRWNDLIGQMPVKLCFPALEGNDWEIVTGADPKNSAWSYHNGGNWPFLLWLFAAAAQKSGHPTLAMRALESAAERLADECWPEYFDGHYGQLVGKEARRFQSWSVAGFLAAYQLLEQPSQLNLIEFGFQLN